MNAPRRIHFIGIGGRAMGAVAIALARIGHRITGSDENMYEPMSGCLRRAGIAVAAGYSASNVPADADLVVVGKRVTEENRELAAVLDRRMARLSFPELLERFFLRRSRNAVVAGGVGKTTTSAMLAFILEHGGRRPDYLVGGIARDFPDPARFDGGAIAVLEGDEYASCFDDPTAKFLHYAPELVAVTNILPDHPDLYPDVAHLHDAFRALVRLIPAHGCLVLPGDDAVAHVLRDEAACGIVTTGFGAVDRPITELCLAANGSSFFLEGARFHLGLYGRMNVRNAAMAAIAAQHFGVTAVESARALAEFRGLADRQEAVDIGGATLVKDKASHPESMRELGLALRQRYPGRRLISVLQPRATGGRRWIYQRDLPAALAGFDKIILTKAYEHAPPVNTAWGADPFCVETLATALRGLGVAVVNVATLAELPEAIRAEIRDGDVVLVSLREQFIGHIAAVEAALLERHAAA